MHARTGWLAGRVRVVVDIDAPPEQVWEHVEPIERHVDWMADAESITFESDQHRGVGTRFRCVTKVGPVRVVDEMEITEWRPPGAMGVRHHGVVTGSGTFTLTPIDLGRRTRFAWDERLRFPWWLGGPLGAAAGAATVLPAIWRKNLSTLRRLVEDDAERGRSADPPGGRATDR